MRDTLVTGTHRIRNQVKESNSGSMALYTKVIGMKIKPMAEADLSMPMVTFMMEIGRTIKLMALELITTLTVPSTRVSGLKTNNMARVKRSGLMALSTKEPTRMVKSMVKAFLTGLTALLTPVIFTTTILKV